MSEPNGTPIAGGSPQVDTDHQRGETGNRNQRTPEPKNPVAHDLPGSVPGNIGVDDVRTRMIPRSNGAGETGPEGMSTEGASGGAGLPGGIAPKDDDRKPKRV